MRNPSFRYRSLAELTDEDLQHLLAEDETLFVEHKTALGGQDIQISIAAASLANTLGGWILVGVTNGRPNEGATDGWSPPESSAFVDHVRQAFQGKLDPIPPFAAALRSVNAQGKRIGVIRVYESADTPHIFRSGAVFVREVAQTKDLQKSGRERYIARGVRSQYALLELMQRGNRARARVGEFLGPPSRLPFLDGVVNLRWEQVGEKQWQPIGRGPRVILRLAPLTRTPRLIDWTVSEAAYEACCRLVGVDLASPPEDAIQMNVSGLAALSREAVQPLDDVPYLQTTVKAVATDSAGVVGTVTGFGLGDGSPSPIRLGVAGVRRGLVEPPLLGLSELLEEAEFYGRVVCQMHLIGLTDVLSIDYGGAIKAAPAGLPLSGELTIPGAHVEGEGSESEVAGLARQWTDDIARAAGHRTLRRPTEPLRT